MAMDSGWLIDDEGFVRTEYHNDPANGNVIINRVQDVEPILENNKRLQNSSDGYTPSRDMKHVASIPLVIYEKWMRDDGVNLFKMSPEEKKVYLRRKLNSSDWAYLRTSTGNI